MNLFFFLSLSVSYFKLFVRVIPLEYFTFIVILIKQK